jgi:O-antigen ligase/Flp pilus assembly protein TadD
MRTIRSVARYFLLAALVLPALAMVPTVMHCFEVPKSALWEPLAVLAAALAWSLPRTRRSEPGAALWWSLWGLWVLVLVWFVVATNTRPLFVGPNIKEFPFLFRVQNWMLQHLAFGLRLDGPGPGDLLFRGTEALAALTLAERAWRSGAVSSSVLRPLPRLALLLAALWSLSAACGLRPDAASPELLDWGAYVLVFTAVWILADDPRMRGRVLAALFFAAALNAFYGLAQTAGFSPLPWTELFNGRANGFFGNPNFLGGHLALLLPLALALALRPATRPVRLLLWGLVWLFTAALVASQTRGAWLGAAAGCSVVFLCAWRLDSTLLRRSRGVLAASALALLLGLGLCWSFSSSTSKARVTGVFSGDPEAGRRVFLMEKTAELAAQHPLLGVGPGAYRVWFPSVEVQGLQPTDYALQDYIISEHGHNDFLQMAADAGWPAALLWGALCVLVLLRLARGFTEAAEEERLLVAGVLGALVAVRVHGLANFPFLIVPTEAAAWAIAALGLRALAPRSPKPAAEDRWAWRWEWALAGLLLASALLVARDRQLSEDGLWWRGDGELRLNNAVGASPLLLKATSFDRREDRLWALHGQSQFTRENIWQSIGSLREAHRLNPYDAQIALQLGLALIENRLYDEAYTVLSGAVAYAPNFSALWEPLGAASFQQKKYADAVKAYGWMLYFHVREEAAYTNKAAALGNLGLLPEARLTLLEAEQKYPDSGKVEINLAVTLYKMGLRKEAYLAWKKAALLSPSDPQVDALRSSLRP